MPVLLVFLTFIATLFLSLSVQIYRLKFFRAIAVFYILCVVAYLAFVSYGILGIGWWKLLLFATFSFGLGAAIKRWRAAAWAILLVLPFSIIFSLSFVLGVLVILALVSYRFFLRRESVIAAIFVYSFLIHMQLLSFFTEPILERPIKGAAVLAENSSLSKSQPASLEVDDKSGLLAAFYLTKKIAFIDVDSGAMTSEIEKMAGAKKGGINFERRMAIGSAKGGREIVAIDIDGQRILASAELGLTVDYAGFLGEKGFVVDSKSGVVAFFDPSTINVSARLEVGKRIAGVCASDDGMVLVSSSGEIFWVDPSNLKFRLISRMFGFFWFSCESLGDGRFSVASPTSGKMALIKKGELVRSFFAGPGVWAAAYRDDELYAGNLFSGKVKVYRLEDGEKVREITICRRLKAMAASNRFLFASTQCGLLKLDLSAF